MTSVLWLLPGLPLAAGALLCLARPASDRLAPWLGVAVGAVALVLAVVAAAGRPSVAAPFLAGLPVGLAVDGLSALMVVTVTAVLLAVLLSTAGERGDARLVGLLLLFAGAMLVTVTATTLLTLLLGWEVMGATSYALISYWWRDPERVASGTIAFLTTRAADVGLYVAAGAAFAGLASLDLSQLSTLDGWELHVVTAGVVVAAAGKSAQLPFSFWLSRAMAGPSQVSALLHSATMVAAGAYLLLRLSPLLRESGWGAPTVAWLGAGTALALGIVAVAQRDLKQLLAASTCAQIGFMVLAAGVAGVVGGAEHLVAHAATKSLLFLAAGAWLAALGTKDLTGLRGAGRRWPVVGAAVAVGGLALAGVPPLSLWVTKDAVLASALKESPALYAVGIAAAALSALYAGKLVVAVLAPSTPDTEARYDTEEPGTRRVPALVAVPVVALAIPAAGLAAFGLPAVAGAVARTLGAEAPEVQWWEAALSAGLAVAGVGLAARLRLARAGGVARWAGGWLGLEPMVHRLVVRPTLSVARVMAGFDDRVVDGVVRGVSAATLASARLANRRWEGAVSGAVGAVAEGSRRLGRLARRPQTGLVHQYYAQAVTVLAALVVVLLVR
jgi:NADH:ubiquinone oxidoreductase subunit 5 (subunit L)/multisubunit Na+/H+ antiporter MnhA subunit